MGVWCGVEAHLCRWGETSNVGGLALLSPMSRGRYLASILNSRSPGGSVGKKCREDVCPEISEIAPQRVTSVLRTLMRWPVRLCPASWCFWALGSERPRFSLPESGRSPWLTCLEDGLWSLPEAYCKLECGSPPVIPNADSLLPRCLQGHHDVGSTCRYECKPGYYVVGGAESHVRR